jgi:hypothetical protein
MSNLVEHAERELALCGQTAEDPAYAASIVEAVRAFSSHYGHSGGSASVAREQLHALLDFQNLAPLTSDPDEWEDRTEMSGTPLWQNRRNPKAFSSDGGKTWGTVEDTPAQDGELTVGDLLRALADEDPATPVVLQKDPEGNGYAPLAGTDLGLYAVEPSGEVEMYDLPGPNGADPDDEEPAPDDAVRCVVLWPTD